jgi:hypothetical protein
MGLRTQNPEVAELFLCHHDSVFFGIVIFGSLAPQGYSREG